jgi:FtsP/CotA-like multicopper oxidase with cupredoxin domain/plastocyanin
MQVPKIGGLSGRLADRVSRRRLIQGSAGGVATSALVAASGVLDDGATIAFAQATPEPQTHEFTLTASEFAWDLMDDVRVRVWGYNGQMPGPELRVTEGDTVRVTLENDLPVPTTIHWHGVNVPNAMDGVAGLNQAPVKPGASFTYEFTATPAGTRWYHSHTDPALQVPMGLYGALIVAPRQAETVYDREYTLMLAEWDTELTPGVAAGSDPIGPKDAMLRGGELGADLFLVNGKMHGAIPPLMVAEGERVLLRLIHTGAIPHPIHTHGHSFQIVATDGNLVPELARWTKDTVLIGPAERYDLAVVADNPGVWMVHCHIEHHMANGMMTTLWYEGYQPTGPAAEAAVAEATMAAMPSHMHPADAPSPTPTEAEPTAVPAGNTADEAFEISMLDDRFEPAEATIPVGTTVTWVNKGTHWHSVANLDLRFTSGKVFPGDRFSFRFEKAGVYKIYCQHHSMAGMNGVITVT